MGMIGPLSIALSLFVIAFIAFVVLCFTLAMKHLDDVAREQWRSQVRTSQDNRASRRQKVRK